MSTNLLQKEKFILPEDTIYLCGHSLGPMVHSARDAVNGGLHAWANQGVSAWNVESWIDLPKRLGTKISSLLGAYPDEVVVSDSVSVNLFKALHSATLLNSKRHKVLMLEDEFPTNAYMVQGLAHAQLSLCVQAVKESELMGVLRDDVAVLMLSHVCYRTSALRDMKAITAKAHDAGILVVWDVSHSVGIVPLDFLQADIDFAVGCTYKYLHGGPGAPGFVFVARKHHDRAVSPLWGWMGHESPFSFDATYTPSKGASHYMVGTPQVLSMLALEGALAIWDNVSVEAVRCASQQHSSYFKDLVSETVPEFSCVSPEFALRRGGHVSFQHEAAYAMSRALKDEDVIVDYREPNLIRFCVHPLYVSTQELCDAVCAIEDIFRQKKFFCESHQSKERVT